ncbi:hypothetical protein [Magnetospirillum gryphiswaldense]|uniref:hypothetical protein n=1 Tax=Magnetospirillum gryphiswaldense TaxID=55518 RepID=UPI001319D13A|nr:hypothetical protein [Magnetospirillum gryphiswaldense]
MRVVRMLKYRYLMPIVAAPLCMLAIIGGELGAVESLRRRENLLSKVDKEKTIDLLIRGRHLDRMTKLNGSLELSFVDYKINGDEVIPSDL